MEYLKKILLYKAGLRGFLGGRGQSLVQTGRAWTNQRPIVLLNPKRNFMD